MYRLPLAIILVGIIAGAGGTFREDLAWGQELKPAEYLEQRIKEIQTIADDDELARRVMAEFDFRRFSQLSFGDYWDRLSADEREEVARLYTRRLHRMFGMGIQYFRGMAFSLAEEKLSGDEAVISGTASYYGDKEKPTRVTFWVRRTSGGWKIYNVNSAWGNLRGYFRADRLIKKSSVQEFLAKLREDEK